MTPDQRALALPDLDQLERAVASPALRVVKEVLQLVRRDPSHFLRADFSDYPMPRQALLTIGVLRGGQIGITIEGLLNGEDDIEIDLFDPRLAPGTPKDESFSYRVNVFGGKEAEQYRKTIGFACEDNAYDGIAPDRSPVIVSDNWAETNLTPQEALALLSGIQELRIPPHNARKTTEKGSPRYAVYTPPTR